MVSAPWEYAWSSAPAQCGVGGDPSGMLDLGGWFERMPTDAWEMTLQAIAASDETIARLRMYTRTGRPLGDESFLKRIEDAIERAIRAKSVGRPKGSKDKVKRKAPKHKRPLQGEVKMGYCPLIFGETPWRGQSTVVDTQVQI